MFHWWEILICLLFQVNDSSKEVLPHYYLKPRKEELIGIDGGVFGGLVLNSSILRMLVINGRRSHLSMT